MILRVLLLTLLASPAFAWLYLALTPYAFSLHNFLLLIVIFTLVTTSVTTLCVWLLMRAQDHLHELSAARTRRRLERYELRGVIEGAEHSVRLASDTLSREVLDALLFARERDVLVRVLLAQDAFTEAVKEGVPLPLAMIDVRTWVGERMTCMVVDERWIVTGSLVGASGRLQDTVMYENGGYGKVLCRSFDAHFRGWQPLLKREWLA